MLTILRFYNLVIGWFNSGSVDESLLVGLSLLAGFGGLGGLMWFLGV